MSQAERHHWAVGLAWVLGVSLVVRVVAAWLFPNLIWADEVYQTLEPAHRIVFGYGLETWEWQREARSWAFPGLLAPLMWAGQWLGAGSDGYLALIRVVLCLVALTPAGVAYAWASREHGRRAGVLAGLTAAVWFQLVFYAPKALTEVVGAHLMLPGLYLAFTDRADASRRRLLVAGCLLGAAAMLRVQLVPGVGVAYLLACGLDRRRWGWLILGAMPAVVASGLVDWITWGVPFGWPFALTQANIEQGIAAAHGVMPWTGYFTMLAGVWGPAGLVLIGLALLAAPRLPRLAVVVVAIFAVHCVIAHKEIRYVYPAVVGFIVMAGVGLSVAAHWLAERVRSEGLRRLIAPTLLLTLLLISLSRGAAFRPALSLMGSEILSPQLQEVSHWRFLRGPQEAFSILSRSDEVCGVGVVEIPWFYTPGYSRLHRNVPLVSAWGDEQIADRAAWFNAAVAPVGREVPGMAVNVCWELTCLLTRPGVCEPAEVLMVPEL